MPNNNQICRNCHQAIATMPDPPYDYYHVNLLDHFEGDYQKAEWCADEDLLITAEDIVAEPEASNA